MANQKLDGLVEAVRYGADGNVASVRMYERRGKTYTDWVIVNRDELVQRLKKGQTIAAGERKTGLGGTFQVRFPIRLAGKRGEEKLVTTPETTPSHDRLDGVPFF